MAGLTLYLLRHAKSGHDHPALADFDRPLNERGRQEAEGVARLMADRGYRPLRVLCSNALRTRETLAPLLPLLRGDAVEMTRRLYTAGAEDLLDIIRGESDDTASMMLIGHNPALEELARLLAGSGDGTALLRLRTKFPPASFVALSFEVGAWADVGPGRGRLEAFETPD